MKRFVFGILPGILLCICAYGQQGNNWCFGIRCGINFGTNPPSTFNSAIFGNWGNGNQSVSDCKGNLMFYAHYNSIYNRFHSRIPNDSLLGNDSTQYNSTNNLLIPINDTLVYYIQSRNDKGNLTLRYSILDMNLDSGRGAISKANIKISDSIGIYLAFVKHSNDSDYWLVAKDNPYTARTYLITKTGISTTPKVSSLIGWSGGSKDMLSFSSSGKYVVTYCNYYVPNYNFRLYSFNNKTGLFKFHKELLSSLFKQVYYPAFNFSPNDSIIYMKGIKKNTDSTVIYQLSTFNPVPYPKTEVFKFKIANQTNGAQLGPDNRLYYYFYKDTSERALSCIAYPDKWGQACELKFKTLDLYPREPYSGVFPCYFFPVKRIANKFNVSGVDGCGYDTARFTFDGDSAFSAAWWYFGDGDSALETPSINSGGQKVWPGVLHQYAQPGSYYVRLACTLGPCGYRQWVGDSVHIKFKPNISLKLTTAYYCDEHDFAADITYRYTDTLRVWLGNNDTTIAVTNSSQPATYSCQFTTDTNGIFPFTVKVSNAQCSDSTGYIYSVKFDPPAAASFQTNNPASCGSSTFTFSDTSQLDSIVVKRTWALRQAQSDTAITSAQNYINITLTDTGKYTVTLTQTTRQGCVDSLTKQDFVWMHPLPEPVIKVDGKITLQKSMCFGDTALLSVTLSPVEVPKYLWSTSDTSKSISVTKTGTYSVKVWDDWNCYATSEPVQLKWLPELKVTLYKTADSLLAKPNRAVTTYEWLRNNQQVAIGNQAYLYHADSGAYQVIVTDSNGCTATSNYQKFYWTGLTPSPVERAGVRSINIYPNPATNELTIECPSQDGQLVSITDMLGRTIYTTKTQGGVTIPVADWPRGLYIITVGGFDPDSYRDRLTRAKVVLE